MNLLNIVPRMQRSFLDYFHSHHNHRDVDKDGIISTDEAVNVNGHLWAWFWWQWSSECEHLPLWGLGQKGKILAHPWRNGKIGPFRLTSSRLTLPEKTKSLEDGERRGRTKQSNSISEKRNASKMNAVLRYNIWFYSNTGYNGGGVYILTCLLEFEWYLS